MYQNFNELQKAPYKKRLDALRKEIKKQKLDGFIVPRTDLHQNEFIEPCDCRLQWISGFTGSAGLCLVTLESAFIFVDGRYRIQVKRETDKSLFNIIEISKIPFKTWFNSNCDKKTIGYDPWLHTVSELHDLTYEKKISKNLKKSENLIDIVWTDRPQRISQLIETHPKKFSGSSSKSKRKIISELLIKANTDAVILTKPESICWLLNIRGKDVVHTPIIQSLAIIFKNSDVRLFLRETNIPRKVQAFLGNDIKVMNQTTFMENISCFKGQTVQIDPTSCPVAVFHSMASICKNIIQDEDPCVLPKAIKNSTEIRGARMAHLEDAVAVINFLDWLDSKNDGTLLDEIVLTKKLEYFRTKSSMLEDISFDTICAYGSNGAIVHYRVTERTNKKIKNNNLLLIDSGGQYRTGTTDLTRTIAIGKPKKRMIDIFTRVLKGMIAISDLKWPIGLSGQNIDSFARSYLWSIGLDYDHGTGHGIGSYLAVHEGPQGISKKNNVSLKPGMLVSNEPGYYETGEFGIRIENILLVEKLPKTRKVKKQLLHFQTLTLVPIDKKLININLLTANEKQWLNNYHADILKKIGPLLPNKTKAWLKKSCQPI